MRRHPLIIIKTIARLLGGLVPLWKHVRDWSSGLYERGEPKLLNVGRRWIDTAEVLTAVRGSRATALTEP